MKLAKSASLVAAALLTLSTAGQAAAAGIQIDGNGRQAAASNTTAYGIAIDPDGRTACATANTSNPGAFPWQLGGRAAPGACNARGAAIDAWGKSGLELLLRLFGWL